MSTFYRIAAFQAITATGNISITKPLTDSSSDNTIYLSDALPIGATELNKCDYVAILVDKEVIACTKANYDSTAKTMSSCIRGVSTEGGDITEQDTTIIKEHEAGTKISCPVIVQNMVQIQELINGEIATGANAFRVGDETDSDIYLYAQNADANKPYLRYNKTENKWYLSNDGTAENPIPETAGGEANASETVKGIVELATQAEVDSGTTTGATGASLAITPDKLNPKNLTNTKATIADGDSTMISNSEAGGALVKVLYSTIKTYILGAATFLGLTDTPSSFSGKGGKVVKVNAGETALEFLDNAYGVLFSGRSNHIGFGGLSIAAGTTSTVASAPTERTTTSTSYVKIKEITCPFSGTYTIMFSIKGTGGNYCYARIYKNGVAFGTEQSTNTTVYTGKSENLTFASGDTIELWIKSGAGITAYAKDFTVQCAVTFTPPSPIGVVNLD